MRQASWYVIQVRIGYEQKVCELIARACANEDTPVLEECFSPRFMTRRKVKGKWKDVHMLLLPGYVVAVSQAPSALWQTLRTVPDFTRLLTIGETFVPLRDEERAWMEEWTTKDDRTVPLSIAYKKGDTIVVTEGPLKGREGLITKINRRKCLAFLELHVDGKRVTTSVGLAILPEEQVG